MNWVFSRLLIASLLSYLSINCYADSACPKGQTAVALCNGVYFSCRNSNILRCNGNNISCVCPEKQNQ